MSTLRQLQERRLQLLEELSDLECVRRGSVVEQHVPVISADGRRYERGPYPIYTFKEQGRTKSRRLHSPAELKMFRVQIENGRRFQRLTAELMRVCEQISDMSVQTDTVKKTPHTKSRRIRKSIGG